MGIVGFSLRRRVTISVCAVALVLFGMVAFGRLPVNLLPDLSYPSLTVETRLPGAAPGEVEVLVTRPVEEVVGVVTGVQRLTSTSRPGLSQVILEFGWGRNMDFAAIDVRQKLDMLQLPREADKPVVLRFDPANDPILKVYLSGGADLYQLRYVAEEVLKKDLESTEGVAAIKVHGGYEEEIQIEVDERKLALLGLTIQEVDRRLRAENVNQAGGSLYEREARYLVRARNEFRSLDDVRRTILSASAGRNVLLGDVAEVRRGHRRREIISRFGGEEAVELSFYKEGDANTVTVARAVHGRLERLRGELPAGVEVAVGADQSRFIRASVKEVLSNALLGGAFAILVLLLFLKDLRSTLIIGVSIPISIIATFFLLSQTGTSLNLMSLGGLALGVGMLVDNAIVVLEAIHKRREGGAGALEAAQLGASEVGRAVIASTLTTVAVFVPVVFLEGIAAQLFLDTALTVSFSLLASLAVSLTLIPMLAALTATGGAERVAAPTGGRFRRAGHLALVTLPSRFLAGARAVLRLTAAGLRWVARPVSRGFDAILDLVQAAYPHLLRRALRSPTGVLAVAGAAAMMAAALAPRLGVDLVPTFSQGEFSFEVELPEGTPVEVTDRFLDEAQKVLAGDPRVAAFSSVAGGAGRSLTRTGEEAENRGALQIQMAPDATRHDEERVIGVLRQRLEGTGLARVKFGRPTYFSFRTPVEVEVYSDSLEDLHAAAEAIRTRVEPLPGLVDVKSSAELGNPEMRVTFRREALARLGIELGDASATLRNKIHGEVATRFTRDDREIDVVVRAVDPGQASRDAVDGMIVAQREGVPIYLKSVADVAVAHGPTEIRRIGQKRAAVVSANLVGLDMRSAAAGIRDALREVAIPPGATAVLSGQEEELGRALASLGLGLGLAIFLVYLVMASQFESLLHPFVILFTLPLGAVGVVGALAVTGTSVNMVAMIGMVMLAGIVVNNAIVLVDAINQRRREGLSRDDAILQAGLSRLRPILMTTATTILGLLPMALGLGEGAELRGPLAVTVIGGLGVGTLLTLMVIPVVYSLLDRKVYAADRATEAAGSGDLAAQAVGLPADGVEAAR